MRNRLLRCLLHRVNRYVGSAVGFLRKGDCAGFKAGSGNAHRLVNRSDRDAVYLEVGTRAEHERVHYPDVDLHLQRDGRGARWLHKSGEPWV